MDKRIKELENKIQKDKEVKEKEAKIKELENQIQEEEKSEKIVNQVFGTISKGLKTAVVEMNKGIDKIQEHNRKIMEEEKKRKAEQDKKEKPEKSEDKKAFVDFTSGVTGKRAKSQLWRDSVKRWKEEKEKIS